MSLVWFDGRVSRDGTISLAPNNRGLALGDGLFETLLVVDGKALWVKAHLARMEASAGALGLALPRQQLGKAVADLEVACGKGLHVLRLTVTRGPATRGLGDDGGEPVVLATATPLDSRLIGAPARLFTANVRRNPWSFAASHKTLSYVDCVVATRAAEARGGDGALMLNTAGFVASTAIGNLFLIKGDTLVTPARDQGVLPGITRSVVLELAQGLRLHANERAVERAELFDADCVFQTNSLRLLNPVVRIDDRLVGRRDSSFVLKAIAHEVQRLFDVNIPLGGAT